VSKPAVTKAIDAIVEAKLTQEPTIVVAHSLGSVVGYNVIKRNLPNIKLVKYITVGCPLGLRAISSKLGLLENPGGPDGWYNAYDPRDVVALNPLDQVYFPADPAIVNYGGVHNQTDNRHSIAGYLNDPSVARQVAEALAVT
jgi:hypothetical protein